MFRTVPPLFVLALVACNTPDDDPTDETDETDVEDTDDTDAEDTDTEDTDTEDTDETDDTDVVAELVSLGTATDGTLTVEMLAPAALSVGWSPVAFRLTDAEGDPVLAATVTQAPLMEMMGGHSHACPWTDPEATADEDGLFWGDLVPIMASGSMGSWSNTVTVHTTDAGTDHTLVVEALAVTETMRKKDLTVGEDKWILTLTPLADLEVGAIPFALTVHHRASMMSFPPVEDLTLTVETTMPSMGHGAEGSVDPTFVEDGRYEGVMGFNMGGEWEVEIGVARGEEDLGSVVFTLDL